MAYWQEYPGPPEMLELQDYRVNARGNSPPAQRVYAPKEPPFSWYQPPLRLERPWREEPAKREGPLTPAEVAVWIDAWHARERRPLVPDRPARARRGRRRRRGGGCAETGLYFGAAWWS